MKAFDVDGAVAETEEQADDDDPGVRKSWPGKLQDPNVPASLSAAQYGPM